MQSGSLEFHDKVLSAKFKGASTPLPRCCRLLFFSIFAIGPFLAALAMQFGYEVLQSNPPRDYGTIHEAVRREIDKEIDSYGPFALLVGYGEGITDPEVVSWTSAKVKERITRGRVRVVESKWNSTEEHVTGLTGIRDAFIGASFESVVGGHCDSEEIASTVWGMTSERFRDGLQFMYISEGVDPGDMVEPWPQPFCDIF